MPDFKEPNYFTAVEGEVEDIRLLGEKILNEPFSDKTIISGNFGKGPDWYQSIFTGTHPRSQRAWDGEARIGEASAMYFYAPDTPEKISNANKDARIIFMLRDPVDRVYSHYWQDHSHGLPKHVFPDFETMLEEDHPRLRYFMRVSSYRLHLERFLTRFPREQLKVITLDEFKADPASVVKRACIFLDVPYVVPPDAQLYNPHTKHRFTGLQNVFHFFRWVYYKKCAPYLPKHIDRVMKPLKTFVLRIEHVNRTPTAYPPMKPEWRAQLLPHFKEDIDFVESFIGKNLSHWREL